MSGNWVHNNGWNKMTATLPSGCWDYRTTNDSYNDASGSFGYGVNIGPAGYSVNGTKIYTWKKTWSSGWKRHCR